MPLVEVSPPGVSLPSIVAVAGRRIDASDAQTARFPYGNADAVREAFARAFENTAAILVVASAACGSDLLALDAASVLGIRTRIILPFPPDIFRETSVADRPYPAYWGGLYDRLIPEARSRGDLVVLDRDRNDPGAYEAANQAIIAEALVAASNEAPPTRPVAVIAWEGAPRGGDDATDNFRRAAVQHGFTIEQVPTLTPV
jgi:hypothetical protein